MVSYNFKNHCNVLIRAIVGALLICSMSSLAFAELGSHTGEKIRILNEQGLPIVGADVLIGSAQGKPFTNNKMKTDGNGTITITDEWQGPQTVTISAEGYLRTSFVNVEPQANEFQLRVIDTPSQIEIKGTTTGFPEFKRDGKVNFGLVYPALHRRQLAQFDLEAVLSPQFDEIKILTESVSIPSNLTLPEQQQTYILPIRLNKPDYRMYVRNAGNYRMMATYGQFPLKQVVSALKDGKAFYEVLNLFKFLEYGERDVVVNDHIDKQDIPVNQVQLSNSVQVKGPTLPSNQVMLAASMTEQGDLYFMSDVKRVESGETVSLGTPSTQNTNDIVSLLMPTEEANSIGGIHTTNTTEKSALDFAQNPVAVYKLVFGAFTDLFANVKTDGQSLNQGPGGISVALHPANEAQPTFLNLVARPTISSDGHTVSFNAPSAVGNVAPLATYAVFSQVDSVDLGHYKVERRTRLWELYSSGWTNQIQLPNLALYTQPGKKYRWEVYFMGTTQSNSKQNAYFLDRVTHVSHNSLDL